MIIMYNCNGNVQVNIINIGNNDNGMYCYPLFVEESKDVLMTFPLLFSVFNKPGSSLEREYY